MLDSDLAALYGVPTKAFNQAVRRNRARFPNDFMFQLKREEVEYLRSQFVTSSTGAHGGRRYLPHAFTELGVAMLSSVLGSDRAVAMNILIMRAFVHLRSAHNAHRELRQRLDELEQRVGTQLADVWRALEALERGVSVQIARKPIGFRPQSKPRANRLRTR